MTEWGRCVTHHICDCQQKKMEELEKQLAEAKAHEDQSFHELDKQWSERYAWEKKAWEKELAEANAAMGRMREALGFYAKKANWYEYEVGGLNDGELRSAVDLDRGHRATEALASNAGAEWLAATARMREMIQSMIAAKGRKFAESELDVYARHACTTKQTCSACLQLNQMQIHNSVIENMEASITTNAGAEFLERLQAAELKLSNACVQLRDEVIRRQAAEAELAELRETTKFALGRDNERIRELEAKVSEMKKALLLTEDPPMSIKDLLKDAVNEGFVQHDVYCNSHNWNKTVHYPCNCGFVEWNEKAKEALKA